MAQGAPKNGRLSTMPLTNGDAEEFHEDFDSDHYKCGFGAWRPSWLQGMANVKAFSATLALWSLFGNMNFTYYTASINQIERDFGLPSSMTGFIKNVDNIGYMLTVVLFSHFFRYSNKPRLFFFATCLSSSAIFLFGCPHFFFPDRRTDSKASLPTINATSSSKSFDTVFCSDGSSVQNEEDCSKGGAVFSSFHAGAVGVFIVSELIQGIGQSPKFTLGMTYLDDNAKKNSPKYFAYMFSMRAFSPVMGFFLGAWTSSIYVNLKDPGYGPRDPRWVGAWWLGFVICAALSIIWAFPLLLFPHKFKPQPGEKPKEDETPSVKELAKDLPKAFVRLLKNKLYIVLIFAICFKIYMSGFVTFLPKYIELQFKVTSSVASILTGVIGATAWVIGPIISGHIVSRYKNLNPYQAMKILVIIMTTVSIGFFIMIFIGCPADKWASDVNNQNYTLECNQGCACDSARYQPICGDDGLNYYSPCHAGCMGEYKDNSSNTVFTDCKCIPGGRAVAGMCSQQCNMIIPYGILLFLTKFVASMGIVPTMTILMRCVDHKDKATSLAIATAIMQIVGFPAPIIGGLVIDTACIIKQTSTCTTRKGACLFYEPETFRYRLHGFVFIINVLSLLCYLLALWLSRNARFSTQEDETEEEHVKDIEKPMIDMANKEQEMTQNTSSI